MREKNPIRAVGSQDAVVLSWRAGVVPLPLCCWSRTCASGALVPSLISRRIPAVLTRSDGRLLRRMKHHRVSCGGIAVRKNSLARSLTLTVLVCVVATVALYALHRIWGVHPVMLFLLGFAAYFYAVVTIIPHVVSRIARRRPPSHERIQGARVWESALSPEEALRSISTALQGSGTVVHAEANRSEIALGSDAAFRRWGLYLEPGRRAIPLRLIVEAKAKETGSQITAESCDDIGWYFWDLKERDKREVENAISELLDQTVAVTDHAKR